MVRAVDSAAIIRVRLATMVTLAAATANTSTMIITQAQMHIGLCCKRPNNYRKELMQLAKAKAKEEEKDYVSRAAN